MSDSLDAPSNPPAHWLDRVIEGVVDHNGDTLTSHQIVNAIMHAPPIVNAIQRALDERGPTGALDSAFAQVLREVFIRVVTSDEPEGGEFLQDEGDFESLD